MEEKKNVFKDIREKTKGMTFGETVSYLWEYYRLHFLLIVGGVIFIISLASAMITNALTDPVLKCGVLSEVQVYCNDELEEALESTFPESTGFKKPTLVSVTSPANESTMMYSSVQLVVLMSANELDCIICDDESLEMIYNSELPVEVTELKDCDLTRLAQAVNIPRLYYVVFTDSAHPDAARRFLETAKTMTLTYFP